jgi:iron complex outermembrane receptor protein
MKKIILLSVFFGMVFNLMAQRGNGKITGSVKGATQKDLQSATIVLLKAKDSSVVKFAVAGKNGAYEFTGIAAGRYIISITSVGYDKVFSPAFEITETKPDVNVAAITMIERVKGLGGVTVTAKKPFVEQKIDRMVVNVESSVTNMGSSALDVLEKSPGISVDKDGNISLKGKQGVIVLIDGRETQLSGLDLANYLRSLNASQLDQIEIMTNPPARFDASGTSGVINIKTKKNKQLGYNGTVNVGYGQGVYPRLNEGLNMNYRQNKVNLFTNLSHNYNKSFNQLDIKRAFRDKNTKELLSNFDQVSRGGRESNNYSARIGLDYFASKNTTLGLVVNGFISDRTSANRNTTNISDKYNNPDKQTKTDNVGEQTFKNFSTNLNFRRVLDTLNSELTADLDYVVYDSKNRQDLFSYYFDAAGTPTDKADSLLGSLPQNINIYSGRIDYLRNLKKEMRIEGGVKTSFVRTDNNAIYDSVVYGSIIHDLNRSNHFIYEENINAAYVNFSAPINKKWSIQTGLRLENTNAKGNQITTNIKFDRNYTQLFPTMYLQYKPDKSNSFVLNYGKRIRRPDYQRLNPFINFIDRYTYQQGNPNLKPQFSHNIELSHGYKGIITTTLNYTRTTDIIQQVLEQNEEKNETYVRQANIAKQRQYGISINITMPVTKWWRNNFFINAFNNKYDGIVNDTFVSISATTLQLNGSQQFTFPKNWSAEISGFFRTGGVEGVIMGKSLGMLAAGVSKDVLKKKATIRLNVRDIFWTQRFRGVSKYSNIDASFRETNDSRVVNIGFTYRFSKGKMGQGAKRRASSASDEQNRVGGGN